MINMFDNNIFDNDAVFSLKDLHVLKNYKRNDTLSRQLLARSAWPVRPAPR